MTCIRSTAATSAAERTRASRPEPARSTRLSVRWPGLRAVPATTWAGGTIARFASASSARPWPIARPATRTAVLPARRRIVQLRTSCSDPADRVARGPRGPVQEVAHSRPRSPHAAWDRSGATARAVPAHGAAQCSGPPSPRRWVAAGWNGALRAPVHGAGAGLAVALGIPRSRALRHVRGQKSQPSRRAVALQDSYASGTRRSRSSQSADV